MTPCRTLRVACFAHRGVFSLAALGLTAALAACSTAGPERPLTGAFNPGLPLAETPLITLDNPELGSFVFDEPIEKTDEGRLEILVPVTNPGAYRYVLNARFTFYDEEGQELPVTGKRVVSLEPGASGSFRMTVTDVDAVDWRAHISWDG